MELAKSDAAALSVASRVSYPTFGGYATAYSARANVRGTAGHIRAHNSCIPGMVCGQRCYATGTSISLYPLSS
jgi:hypothetical protein